MVFQKVKTGYSIIYFFFKNRNRSDSNIIDDVLFSMYSDFVGQDTLHSIDPMSLYNQMCIKSKYVYDLTREIAKVLTWSTGKLSMFAFLSELFLHVDCLVRAVMSGGQQ